AELPRGEPPPRPLSGDRRHRDHGAHERLDLRAARESGRGRGERTAESPGTGARVRPYVVLYNKEDNVRGGDERDSIAARDAAVAAAAVEKALARLGPTVLVEVADPA